MVMVTMVSDDKSFCYDFHGGVDPKDYTVEVTDGRLYVKCDIPVELRSGETKIDKFSWDTKLSRHVDPSSSFEVRLSARAP